MSFDMLDVGFEPTAARPNMTELGLEVQDESPALATKELARDARFELIRQLARQLALAHGEDPDEQPYPLRFPRWRYHCARAKVLLSISEAEHRALTAVLGKGVRCPTSPEPEAGWVRFWPARRSRSKVGS